MNAAPARQRPDDPVTRRLTVVPTPRLRAARTPFVILVVAILGSGLLGLLLLNTALAQGSFRMNDLQQRTAALQDREQQLQIAVDAANNPSRLAAAAQKLGLVAAEDPGFLRLSDGRILGNPQPAHAAPRKKPAATPTPNASVRPSNKPAAGAAAQPRAQASPQPSAKPAAKPSAGPSAKPRH